MALRLVHDGSERSLAERVERAGHAYLGLAALENNAESAEDRDRAERLEALLALEMRDLVDAARDRWSDRPFWLARQAVRAHESWSRRGAHADAEGDVGRARHAHDAGKVLAECLADLCWKLDRRELARRLEPRWQKELAAPHGSQVELEARARAMADLLAGLDQKTWTSLSPATNESAHRLVALGASLRELAPGTARRRYVEIAVRQVDRACAARELLDGEDAWPFWHELQMAIETLVDTCE